MNRGREMNAAAAAINGELIVRLHEPYKKSNRQTVNKLKKEKKKEMTKQAKIFRSLSAQGNRLFVIQSDDDEDEDDAITADADDDDEEIETDESFYRSVPPNVCNICGEIFNSVKGRRDHMTTRSRKHQRKRYKFDCTYPQCGCYYASNLDLKIHRELERH